MSNLILGLLIGVTGGFAGTVIYLSTYLKAIESTIFRLEDEVKEIKVTYNITVPSPSTSFDKETVEPERKNYFKPF